MKILAITLALIAVVAVTGILYLKYRLNNAPDNKDLETAIDSEIRKLTNNGASYSLVIGVYKNGKSFIKGYGTVNKEGAAVPGASTVFQIASVSKLFTASLLQLLCDEGVVKVDATLGELIGESVALSPAAREVTLKQLVTHTSGFPKDPKPLVLKVTKLVGKENLLQNPFSHIEREDIFMSSASELKAPAPARARNVHSGLGSPALV